MKRLLWIWLTLLGAWWTAAALVSAVLYQRAVRGPEAVLRPILVTLFQALVLWWVTRPSPPAPLPRAGEGSKAKTSAEISE